MIVIIAKINGSTELSKMEASEVNETCKKMNIPVPINVSTSGKLKEVLEKHKDQDCLLFSNFPPDSEYPGSGKRVEKYVKNDITYRFHKADSYVKSNALYNEIFAKYSFNAIHFITGAPENMISDEMLKSLSPNTLITVNRNNDWIHPNTIYSQSYKRFVMKKIKEAVTV